MAFTKTDYCPVCDRIRTVKQASECGICNTETEMKDDSLDDTGTRKVKIMYGGKPINQAIADGDTKMVKPDAIKALAQSKTDINKLGRVDIERLVTSTDSVYAKEIWNAAIEAAALVAIKERHNAEMSDEIRKLKK